MREIQKQSGAKHQEERANLLHTLMRAAKADHVVDAQWGWDAEDPEEPRLLVDGVPVQVDDGDASHPMFVIGRPPYQFAEGVEDALKEIKGVLR